jgi:UPF0271 protein
MIEINVDMGERGFAHPEDLELLSLVNRVNLAVGGHAGDKRTALDFQKRAMDLGVMVSAHPSYPDREHFGRRNLEISMEDLISSLSQQCGILEDVRSVKFHGALYNQAWVDDDLARSLAQWCVKEGYEEVLCPPGSFLERRCSDEGISVLREGFSDRAYIQTIAGEIALMPRGESAAVLSNEKALRQVQDGYLKGRVPLAGKKGLWFDGEWDTWCIHSDRPGAVVLASLVREWLQGV